MCLKVASLTKPVAKIDTADTDTEDNDEVTKNECAAGTVWDTTATINPDL